MTSLHQIGWSSEGTHTDDPRILHVCSWCSGSGVIFETVEGSPKWVLWKVVCRNCNGRGKCRIERRRGTR